MINNTIPSFLKLLESNDIGLHDLNKYYDMHPEAFEEYFKFHCPKTEERLSSAIEKYPAKLEDIRIISEILPSIIQEVSKDYRIQFGSNIDVTFHIFVGGFGSNTFVEREIIGDIFFAAEKLSPVREHLRVIVAHEIGHIYHNVALQENGMDWTKAEWNDAPVSLYREGVATYLSQLIVKGLSESVYYSYSSNGDSSLQYYKEIEENIKKRFLQDYVEGWTVEKEKEWFRLSGGTYFGYNRLGYFLGKSYIEYMVRTFGETEALTFGGKNNLRSSVMEWLQK
ncbi:aminopeptidase [Bacillus mycoides]|uniref:Aminopeptidase n=1 Tax=Bacillus mycoides TaxID=1405 RepID=A0A1W6A9Q0_BACMY|nr:aminopeptidase [Bacillus mycoides]ARJ22514.1 aminopeptidase [Bacillus mycoides]TKI78896.1 aminopeptidase [Bacillus mycoides]